MGLQFENMSAKIVETKADEPPGTVRILTSVYANVCRNVYKNFQKLYVASARKGANFDQRLRKRLHERLHERESTEMSKMLKNWKFGNSEKSDVLRTGYLFVISSSHLDGFLKDFAE